MKYFMFVRMASQDSKEMKIIDQQQTKLLWNKTFNILVSAVPA